MYNGGAQRQQQTETKSKKNRNSNGTTTYHSSGNSSETTVYGHLEKEKGTRHIGKTSGINRTKSKMKGLMEVESTYSRYRTLTHQKLQCLMVYIEDTISKKFTRCILIIIHSQPLWVVSVCFKPFCGWECQYGRVNIDSFYLKNMLMRTNVPYVFHTLAELLVKMQVVYYFSVKSFEV